MNDRDLRRFLDRRLLAVVTTVRGDGGPHAVPVWYRYDGERAFIWSDESRLWVRNLRRDPRCALTVHEHEPPYAAVLLRGLAEVATGDDAWITEEARRITARYIDADGVDDYLRTWVELRTIVTVVPESRSAWGRGY